MNGKKKRPVKLDSTRVLDYPEDMSQYEKESLAAEAILKAEREKTKRPQPSKS